jgi:Squalene-hopene cyclase C-terminal domain
MRGLLALVLLVCSIATGLADELITPERRAVAFLSVEVPKWARENKCFSCHNNGDALHGLLTAAKAGELADRKPLADTLAFLASPERWDANGPDGPFKDTKLARIQFAAALAAALDAGMPVERGALVKAAALVAPLQSPDGSWQTDVPGSIGSPATYGRALATATSIRTLSAADRKTYAVPLAKARRWFETTEPKNVLDAAASLLALAEATGDEARQMRERALVLLRKGESPDGGWGPFVNSPPEVFDTALVVLALAAQQPTSELSAFIARGRKYLLAEQSPDGSWPATTRPAGADSYAQQLSTTGWALQALYASRERAGK